MLPTIDKLWVAAQAAQRGARSRTLRVRMAKPKGATLPGVERWHGGYAYLA